MLMISVPPGVKDVFVLLTETPAPSDFCFCLLYKCSDLLTYLVTYLLNDVAFWSTAEPALPVALRRNDSHSRDSESARLRQRAPSHRGEEPRRSRGMLVIAVGRCQR